MAEVKLIGSTDSLFCAGIEFALKFKGIDYEYSGPALRQGGLGPCLGPRPKNGPSPEKKKFLTFFFLCLGFEGKGAQKKFGIRPTSHKGRPCEYLVEDLNNKSPILLKYNPIHKKVPVLLHHDKPIAESLVILEYIEEVWKENPLLPQDPYERAIARFWAKFGDEKVLVEAYGAFLACGEEKERLINSSKELLSILEKEIQGKKYFAGETIGYLDLVMGWITHELKIIEEVAEMSIFDANSFPNLHVWSTNFSDTPLVKQCFPSKEVLYNYFRGALAK